MNKTTHGIIQGAGAVIQVLNLATGIVPAKYQPIVAAVVGLIQAVVALYNHPAPEPAPSK